MVVILFSYLTFKKWKYICIVHISFATLRHLFLWFTEFCQFKSVFLKILEVKMLYEFYNYTLFRLSRYSYGKESACNAGDLGLMPGLGRSPGEGHGNPLQYSCLENSMDRGTRWATVHGISKSWTQLSD